MPRVPTIDGLGSVAPQGLPQVQQSIGAVTPDSFGDIQARQAAQVGQAVQGLATDLYMHEQNKLNEARVADAIAKTQTWTQKKVFDPQEGFINQTGEAVFKRPSGKPLADEVAGDFDKFSDEVSQGLGNDFQRQAYKRAIASQRSSFYETALRHEADQTKKIESSSFQALAEAGQQQVALFYNDDSQVGAAVNQIKESVRQYGLRASWSAEQIKVKADESVSAAHLGAIAKMQADGNSDKVEIYIQKHGGQFTASDAAKAQQALYGINAESIQRSILISKGDGDKAALQTILQSLESDKGDLATRVSPAQRNALLSQAMSAQTGLANAERIASEKREREASQAVDRLQKMVVSGGLIDSTVWQDVSEKVKGTSLEGADTKIAASYSERQKFDALPLADQAAQLREMQAKADITPTKDPVTFQRYMKAYENVYQANLRMAKEKPLEYYTKITQDRLPVIDFTSFGQTTNAGQSVDNLRDRMTALSAMQKRDGYQVATNPFYPEEIAALKKTFAEVGDDQKLTIMSMLSEASLVGNKTDSERMLAGAISAISDDNPALRLAGFAHAQNLKSTNGASVANLVLQGDRVRKEKTVTLPQDAIIQQEFNSAIAGAVPVGSQMHRDMMHMTQLVYAGLSARDSKIDQAKDVVDEDLFQTAFSLATGGVVDHAGSMVLKPYGMANDTFDKKLQASLQGAAASAGLDVADIDDSPLVPVINGGEGQYHVSDGMGGVVINPKTKRPLLIEVQR